MSSYNDVSGVNPNVEDDDFDIFDSALNLEQNAYKEGYEEGLQAGKIAGIHEGAEYGMQTGFYRYIALGVLQGRCKVWRLFLADIVSRVENQEKMLKSTPSESIQDSLKESSTSILTENEITSLKTKISKADTSLTSLEKLLDPETLPMSNSDVDVARFELIIRKAKSKAKIVQNSMKIKVGDGLDLEEDDPPLDFHDQRIQHLLKPLEDVVEDFRI